jgi:hypothetical protein
VVKQLRLSFGHMISKSVVEHKFLAELRKEWMRVASQYCAEHLQEAWLRRYLRVEVPVADLKF